MKYFLTTLIVFFYSHAFAETSLSCSCLKNDRNLENHFVSSNNNLTIDKVKLKSWCDNSNFNLVYNGEYMSIRASSGFLFLSQIQLGAILSETEKSIKYEIIPVELKDGGGNIIDSLYGNFYFDKINKIVRIDSMKIKYIDQRGAYTKLISKSYMKLQCK